VIHSDSQPSHTQEWAPDSALHSMALSTGAHRRILKFITTKNTWQIAATYGN
jgi:hypothetical protein